MASSGLGDSMCISDRLTKHLSLFLNPHRSGCFSIGDLSPRPPHQLASDDVLQEKYPTVCSENFSHVGSQDYKRKPLRIQSSIIYDTQKFPIQQTIDVFYLQ